MTRRDRYPGQDMGIGSHLHPKKEFKWDEGTNGQDGYKKILQPNPSFIIFFQYF